MEPRRCTAITYVRCRRERPEQLQQDSTSRSFEQWKVIQGITILAIRRCVAIAQVRCRCEHPDQIQQDSTSRSFGNWKYQHLSIAAQCWCGRKCPGQPIWEL